MHSLTAAQKYSLLTKHKMPHKIKYFPLSTLVVVIVVSDTTGLKNIPGWHTVNRWMVCFAFLVPFSVLILQRATLLASHLAFGTKK